MPPLPRKAPRANSLALRRRAIVSAVAVAAVAVAAAGCGTPTESGLTMTKAQQDALFTTPLPPSGEIEPGIVAVSPDGDRVLRTVQPKRRGLPRADLELLSTTDDQLLWRLDLNRFSVPNFGRGAWVGNRVAMPKGELVGFSEPRPDTLTVIEFGPSRRRPRLLAHWTISPYPGQRTTTKNVTFESRDVVTAIVYPPATSSAPLVHYRCTIGQPFCATQPLTITANSSG